MAFNDYSISQNYDNTTDGLSDEERRRQQLLGQLGQPGPSQVQPSMAGQPPEIPGGAISPDMFNGPSVQVAGPPQLPQAASTQPSLEITKEAKQAQAETLATGKQQAQEAYGGAVKGAQGAYAQKMEEAPIPAFVPTKDNAQDLANLFSVMNVIGMLIGGGGRQAAVQAMSAMNGMAQGYQQGRQDLYKQERDTFDKNVKVLLKKHEDFRKELEDAIKLASVNKEAGIAAAELAATKAGSSIIKAQIRNL